MTPIREAALLAGLLFAGFLGVSHFGITITQRHIYPVEGFTKELLDRWRVNEVQPTICVSERPVQLFAIEKRNGYVLGSIFSKDGRNWHVWGTEENTFKTQEAAESAVSFYWTKPDLAVWYNPDKDGNQSFLLPDTLPQLDKKLFDKEHMAEFLYYGHCIHSSN